MRIVSRAPWYSLIAVVGFLLFTSGCGNQTASKPKSIAPAKVEMVPHESDLATITLTVDAEKRLGISTVATKIARVQQHRKFGGEVIIPPGRSIMITAPVSGIVAAASEVPIPIAGSTVKAGDAVLELAPLLSPERDVPTPAEQVQMASARAAIVAAQVTAEGDVQRGKADVAAARITLERATKLLADRAGSQRAADDAQAIANVAKTVLAAAEERNTQLTKLLATLELKPSHELATKFTLRAPVDGLVRNIGISAGQQVVAGAPLMEVLDTSTVWIRVAVFVDLLPNIQPGATGRVESLSGKSIGQVLQTTEPAAKIAVPVSAPPTADAGSSSADLYFEIPNADSSFRPGQRVGMDLPMHQEVEAVIVPAAAILYDIHGGSWVYAVKEPLRFERKRVTVMWIDGSQAMLQKGPPAGTLVVSDGAAELFGTEFGPGK